MKKYNNIWLLLIAICSIFASCKKDKTDEEQLPAITQTGANTFGCLINGKIYTPKGFEQNTPNFRVFVDPGFNDGEIDVRVFRKSEVDVTDLSFSSDSVKSEGLFVVSARTDFRFAKYTPNIATEICSTPYSNGSPIGKTGFIKITRYDLVNRIVSGEFEFHFSNPACGIGDPIHITQGRFDKKL